MPFKIYTENKYMGTLSLAIVSISISKAMGDGTETRSRLVTEINGHRDKRSLEIITPKNFKGFNNDIIQTEYQDKHCLNTFGHLVCAILLFTPLRCKRFEDRLSL